MQLTVLGGSAAGPNPGQGCSGYLVQSGATRVVLDLGPGTFPELRKHVDFREVDGIILSHLHLDHWLDILAMRFALAYNPVPPQQAIPFWLPPGGLALLERLARAIAGPPSEHEYFSVFVAREFDPISSCPSARSRFASTRRSTIFRVGRSVPRMERDGDLLYTADTGPSADLCRSATGSFAIVAEGTSYRESAEPSETRGHLTPSEAGNLARQANAGILVLSHLWAENDPFAAVDGARRAFGGPVELATPGLTISRRRNAIERIGRWC